MGILEKEAGRQRRRAFIQAAVLATVATAGILLVAAAAPNTLQLLGGINRQKKPFEKRTHSALARLAEKGQIRFEKRNGKSYARITKEGKRALLVSLYKGQLPIKRKPRWDARWRIIIFDIPETKRAIRKKLRSFMQQIGFLRVQDSVWAYPYDCEEIIGLMKAELRTGRDVLYMIVENIENDAWMRKRFELPEKNRRVEIRVPGTSFDLLSLLYK